MLSWISRQMVIPYSSWLILLSCVPDRLRHFYKQNFSNVNHWSSSSAMISKCSPNWFQHCIMIAVIWNINHIMGVYQYNNIPSKTFRTVLLLAQIARFMGPNMGPTWALSAPDGPQVGPMSLAITLHRRHNDYDGLSNHQPHGCLLNRLFRRRSKKTSKLRVTGLCTGNSPGTGEFPAQMASYAEKVSIWCRHHQGGDDSPRQFHSPLAHPQWQMICLSFRCTLENGKKNLGPFYLLRLRWLQYIRWDQRLTVTCFVKVAVCKTMSVHFRHK